VSGQEDPKERNGGKTVKEKRSRRTIEKKKRPGSQFLPDVKRQGKEEGVWGKTKAWVREKEKV